MDATAGVANTDDVGNVRWDTLMERLARRLKRILKATSPLAHESERTPEALAFHDFILDFPFPTQIMLVEAGTDSATSMKRTFTLVRFNLAEPKSSRVNFHGLISAEQAVERREVLWNAFGVQRIDLLHEMKEFSVIGDWQFTHFVRVNIAKDLDSYAQRLFSFLAEKYMSFVRRHYRGRHVEDFNAKYGLTPSPVLSKEELLQPHPFSESIVYVPTGQSLTIEDWQSDVVDIQLIPQVPADVRSTFEAAKQLYIFGYFQWRFFTIALHYACLAMEAAVKHRWVQSLPDTVPVEYSNGVKNEIVRPQYELLYRHWRADRKLKICGKQFPSSMPSLIHSLKQKKLVAAWEAKRIQNCIDERNELSHLEMATVLTPRPSLLRDVAELTNLMFDRRN